MTTTRAGDQCICSAKYTGIGIKKNVFLCKMHADMADFPVKRITARSVTLR